MRRLYRAARLSLAPVLGLALVCGSAASARPPKGAPVKEADGAVCGSYGTTIEFVDTPREAAQLALKQEKLVFVLHVSGNFEDPRFL
jgi:hypothetical protein